ncbi:MAG: hypothetical protein ACFHWZ_08575 [Phycisphaerales bacterium]
MISTAIRAPDSVEPVLVGSLARASGRLPAERDSTRERTNSKERSFGSSSMIGSTPPRGSREDHSSVCVRRVAATTGAAADGLCTQRQVASEMSSTTVPILRFTAGWDEAHLLASSMRERSTSASGDSGSDGADQVSLDESVMSMTLERSALSSTDGGVIACSPSRAGGLRRARASG